MGLPKRDTGEKSIGGPAKAPDACPAVGCAVDDDAPVVAGKAATRGGVVEVYAQIVIRSNIPGVVGQNVVAHVAGAKTRVAHGTLPPGRDLLA